MIIKFIKIGRIPHKAFSEKQVYGGLSRIDIHGPPADEVFDPAFDLWRASLAVGTVMSCFILFPDQLRAAFGTAGYEAEGQGSGAAPGFVHAHDLGDDLSTLFHVHSVPEADIQQGDLISIVQ